MKAPKHLMDQTIAVTRPVATVDAGGSPIETFTAHIASAIARIWPVAGSENVAAGRPATQATFNIVIEGGQDVAATDRIPWGTRTLKIIEPPMDFGSQGIIERVVGEEVTP